MKVQRSGRGVRYEVELEARVALEYEGLLEGDELEGASLFAGVATIRVSGDGWFCLRAMCETPGVWRLRLRRQGGEWQERRLKVIVEEHVEWRQWLTKPRSCESGVPSFNWLPEPVEA